MSKHTPGPWIGAGPSFGDPLPRYTTEIVTEWEDEDGEAISICELPFHHHDDENEANARLIAAAPMMYEALKKIEPILARMYGPQATELPPMQIVRAAIAEAEGA